MISCEAQRTLVKSPPELWAKLSDPDALAQHLGEFGEIHIVRVEPESSVEWEGEGVSGSVALKASGWGTKVTLTAIRRPPEAPASAEPVAEPEPEPVAEPAPEPKFGFFARIFRRRPKMVPMPEPDPEPEAQAQEEQADISAELLALEEAAAAQTTAVLTGVLDRLGAAHHRPFSRA